MTPYPIVPDDWAGMTALGVRRYHSIATQSLGCSDLVVRIRTFGVSRWRWSPRVTAHALARATAGEEDIARGLSTKLDPAWVWFVAPWNADGRPSALAVRVYGSN
jgi:hypothetical protein